MSRYANWVREFQLAARTREDAGDPEWARGACLDHPVVRSVQRFQVGESGDGANLIRSADQAGDAAYSAAVRLFVAEEQNHARLLARLLESSGAPTIRQHWTNAVFVSLRRALGLRLELMVLLIAEVVALSYYRALLDRTGDPLAREVATRVLADEERHVAFHCHRLHADFRAMPRPVWWLVRTAWRLLHTGAATVVAWDHRYALRVLGVCRRGFVAEQVSLFTYVLRDVRRVPATAPPEGMPRMGANPT